jgi:lysophospholipase L1-like esterase
MATRTTALRTVPFLVPIICLLNMALPAHAEHEGKLQILLIGDSTAEGSIPRKHVPEGPHLEQVIQQLLAAEGDLPPVNVINVALSGEFIQRFVETGRYEKVAAKLPGLDYIIIRYGLNDVARREKFDENFPKDFHNLLALLHKDHPQAVLIPMTVIPIGSGTERINTLVKKVADEEKLPLFDIVPRYSAELEKGPNMLNYPDFPCPRSRRNIASSSSRGL